MAELEIKSTGLCETKSVKKEFLLLKYHDLLHLLSLTRLKFKLKKHLKGFFLVSINLRISRIRSSATCLKLSKTDKRLA